MVPSETIATDFFVKDIDSRVFYQQKTGQGNLRPHSGRILFGGGTSLVCAYDELTKRLSEDADFRFVPCPKSTKRIREDLAELANSMEDFKLMGEPISDSRKIEFRFIDNANLVQEHSSLRH